MPLNQSFFSKDSVLKLNNLYAKIASGVVAITEGNKIISLWGDGDLIIKSPEQSAIAITDVRVTLITPSSIKPEDFIYHVEMLNQFLAIARIISSRERTLEMLSLLAQKFGVKRETGIAIKFPVTHQMLGDLTTTSVITIAKILLELERKGAIAPRKRRKYSVLVKL
jgi:CRP-like cAMP-binding protein